MKHRIKIETTIKGGLLVIAQADVHTCPSWEYPGGNYIEQLDVFFQDGHLFMEELSEEDDDKVCDEILASFNSGDYRFNG